MCSGLGAMAMAQAKTAAKAIATTTPNLASAEIDGKTGVILPRSVARNEIAVETPFISLVATRNLLDLIKLAPEVPVK
jgi:hypothetical protein